MLQRILEIKKVFLIVNDKHTLFKLSYNNNQSGGCFFSAKLKTVVCIYFGILSKT